MTIGFIESFIEQCQAKGLAPGDAMILFREQEQFGAESWISRKERARPEVQTMLARRERVLTALDHIQSPADLNAYAQGWLGIVMGYFPPDDPSQWKDLGGSRYEEASQQLVQDFNARGDIVYFMPSEGLPTEHVTGGLQYGTWSDIRRSQPDWDDVRYAMEKTQLLDMTLAAEDIQASPKDYAELDATGERLGLRAIQWPWLGGDQQAMVKGLTQWMEQANQDLVVATGLSGSVLGLGGRTRVGVGVEKTGSPAFGGVDSQSSGGCFISSPPEVGMGAMAHEWLHAFDAMIGHLHGLSWGHMASEANDLQVARDPQLNVWRTMVHHLDHYAEGERLEEIREQAYHQALSGTQERWEAYFAPVKELTLDWATLLKQSQAPRWNKQKTEDTLLTAMRTLPGIDEESAHSSVVMILTEMELLRQRAVPNEGASLWQAFRLANDRNLKDRGLTEQLGYLSEPTEMLAHSFEIKFPKTSRIVDRFSGETSMRYPMAVEVDAQDQHWKAFFQAQRADWDRLMPPAAPMRRRSLGETLGKKAPASAERLPALPLVARPRGLTPN